jgi:hypothetical protein
MLHRLLYMVVTWPKPGAGHLALHIVTVQMCQGVVLLAYHLVVH